MSADRRPGELTLALAKAKAERDAARAARDAARAEARVAKSEIRVLAAFLAEARAEVAALQVLAQDANEAFAAGRREVLADLRAKVEWLYVRCTDDPWRNEELTDWVRRDAVLALFDEAQP